MPRVHWRLIAILRHRLSLLSDAQQGSECARTPLAANVQTTVPWLREFNSGPLHPACVRRAAGGRCISAHVEADVGILACFVKARATCNMVNEKSEKDVGGL